MSDLGRDAKELLEAARAAEPRPRDEDKARIKAMIAAAIAAPVAIDPSPVHAATGSIGLKIAGAVLAVGIAGAVLVTTRDEPAPPPMKPKQEVTVEPQAPVMPEEIDREPPLEERSIAEPEVSKPKRTAKRAPMPAEPEPETKTPASLLAEEAALLRSAKAALRAGDPEASLAKVKEHAERFPAGELSEERIAVEAMALCQAGRPAEAGAAKARLPEDSAYRTAVDERCP